MKLNLNRIRMECNKVCAGYILQYNELIYKYMFEMIPNMCVILDQETINDNKRINNETFIKSSDIEFNDTNNDSSDNNNNNNETEGKKEMTTITKHTIDTSITRISSLASLGSNNNNNNNNNNGNNNSNKQVSAGSSQTDSPMMVPELP